MPDGRALGASRARRSDIDLLRVVACYLGFPLHSAAIFGHHTLYHVKNAIQSAAFDAVADFLHQWRMPLFFLIAGWSAFTVLARRSNGTFLRERLDRLLVPVAFGVILFCPIMKYIERRGGIDLRPSGPQAGGDFTLSFLEFLPRFFGNLNQFSWSHLWFLIYLLVFSVVWLPLLRRMARMTALEAAAWIYLPLLPLILVQITLRPVFGDYPNLYSDWANLTFYSVFFLAGAMLACHAALEEAVRCRWPWLGALALVAYAGRTAIDQPVLRDVFGAVVAWGFVLALLGFARRWQEGDGPAVRYLRDSALPIYVLHNFAVVALGAWVVGLSLSLPVKFAAVLAGSVVVTLATYHVLVRRSLLLRRLCGMRLLPVDAAAAVAPRRVEQG